MSYHADWEWNIDQFQGFKDALASVDVEYRVFEMNTKRLGAASSKFAKAEDARAMINAWRPDLVYTNDDDAQELVTRQFLGSEIPFVFSGVNADPAVYGLTGSSNVTGVLEKEHVLETIRLLRSLVPNVRRIAVIIDEGPTWPGVVETMTEALDGSTDVEVTEYRLVHTFAEYKTLVEGYQRTVDAIAPLGIFRFKNGQGETVDYVDVLRWTAEHSHIPDFAFWRSRVVRGTLCAVSVSGYAQGHAAGQLARAILVDGTSPAALPMQSTRKGRPVVNLARARSLGISLGSSQLLAAEVIRDYRWNQ
jgi:ABC-type uncharacterized transport system substrate-binding protein